MADAKPSKNALKGEIIKIRPGLAIYQTNASPYWFARIRDPNSGKYVVRSTKEKSRIKGREAAEELASELMIKKVVQRQFTFRYFAERYVETGKRLVAEGERNANYIRTTRVILDNDQWGLVKHFGPKDVREVKTRHWIEFLNKLSKDRPDLSPSTRNHLSATFRNVMKEARLDGTIDDIPDTPRTKIRDNPRPFFRFYPLVPKDQDAVQKLLRTTVEMALDGVTVRGVPVTPELYNICNFVLFSFVRPITSELFAIKHKDIAIAHDPARLLVTIRNGKTGYRVANTLPKLFESWKFIHDQFEEAKPSDFLFLPTYTNRVTAGKIIQRQFKELLKRAGLETDPFTGKKHSIYSLRHTAICMRIIHSEGKVNIFNLAKNAGTSVEQIERFYAKHLPLSAELARNLHLGEVPASDGEANEALDYYTELTERG